MKNVARLFALRREERWIALGVVVVVATLEALMICQYSPLFLKGGNLGFWSIFEKNFRMSGYDCWSYITISNMRVHFETARHPLFFSILYPMYLLNHELMSATGTNYAVFFMALLTLACSTYATVFLYRTMREVIGLGRFDATLLTVLFLSFAHVVVSMIAPDHFAISLMLLMLTVYLSGAKMKSGKAMRWWQTCLLLFLTAGVTVTNGAKTALAALWTNGRRFFGFKQIVFGIVMPSLLLLGVWHWQYQAVEIPQQREIKKIEKALEKKNGKEFQKRKKKRGKWISKHKGKPISDKPLLSLTDMTTPRWDCTVENFFGESLQLHDDYLLQDMSFTRPVVVRYSHWHNYAVEALLVAMILMSLAVGMRSRLMLMLMSWWLIDMTIHIVLGFGLNEAYIMTTSWAFIIPIAFATAMKRLSPTPLKIFRGVNVLLALYLICWNGSLLIRYLLTPMKMLAK